MSTSKKGFDPLGSLFDLPEPGPAVAAPPPAKGQAPPEPSNVKPAGAPAGPDPVELARMVARAAQAKAAMKKPAASTTLVPDAPPVAKPAKPARATAPAAPAAPVSRLSAAPPPQRTLSAADALRMAQATEARAGLERAQANAAPAAAPAPTPAAPAAPAGPLGEDGLVDVVSGIIKDSLPSIGDVYVARAVVMDDRGVLTALWRAHRARFIADRDFAGAVSVLAVLRALASVGRGQLVAAHAVTDKSDWLLWVDLGTSSPIAAFKDARAWLAGS